MVYYSQALTWIIHAPAYTPEGDEPGGSILIEKYEKEHYPTGSPYPITAIKFRQEYIKRE